MKVLYFSATGNSLYIAKSIGGELCSIPQMVKEGTYEFTDEKIGIIFPLHAWSVPPYIVDFLKKATFNCDYLFAVVTYGIYSGAVAKHLSDIADEAGFGFSYISRIRMVDNYLPTFDMKKQVAKEPKKQIEKHLEAIKSDIAASKKGTLKENCFDKAAMNYMFRRDGKPFNKKRLKVHVVGEGIENYVFVEDSCTQCGVCASVCPVNNIEMDMKNGKIALSDKCFMCFACVHNCPSNAIHIKGEVSSARFRNSHVTLKEIIHSNNQV
ncbi:EFR1 family ferrodoxin [Desulfovibrio sp. JC022]|uniref:EFR1 family ferrodoxin n=1 Tax=Desulfovibrio sp. JC022 TaxID=2593642 RepID=UPI0013D7E391|nr:EFR1 family ferrodoxin [Desulfovibrio sp. JC022]NDV22997.1 4Fe-4S dicluster domain-containing protein [Desulfovibrio sp. JC022]